MGYMDEFEDSDYGPSDIAVYAQRLTDMEELLLTLLERIASVVFI